MAKHKLVGISEDYFKYFDDSELLSSTDTNGNRRPFVIIMRLKYRGEKRNFAIPLRSNIPSYYNSKEYVSLPPRDKTKSNYVHGLHIIKMFPVTKKFFLKYHVSSIQDKLIQAVIDKNFDEVFEKAKSYLNDLENDKPHKYGVDIDNMIRIIEQKDL